MMKTVQILQDGKVIDQRKAKYLGRGVAAHISYIIRRRLQMPVYHVITAVCLETGETMKQGFGKVAEGYAQRLVL